MFQVHYADGSKGDVYETTQECLNECETRWPNYFAGHDGDLEEGGDRTLVWADEASSEDDDGANAVASIRRADDSGAESEDEVILETMPDHLRASHRAAGNWGGYPHNGAERRTMSREEAETEIEEDADGYAHIVG